MNCLQTTGPTLDNSSQSVKFRRKLCNKLWYWQQIWFVGCFD